LFIPAVLVSAALGGLICGLFATVFASLAVGMVTRDDPQNLVGALSGVLFLLVGIGMAIGGGWFHAARRRAAATNAHLRSILDTVPDAVVVIDRAGVMTSFSPAAERTVRLDGGRGAGPERQPADALPAPRGPRRLSQRYYRTGERRIIGIGRVVVGERKDGSTFPMELAVGETKGRALLYRLHP
jgi:two-component system sensor kinase FixL